jgi:hypothetical protein
MPQADIIEKKREKRSQKSKQQKLSFGGSAKVLSPAASTSELVTKDSSSQRSAGLSRAGSSKRTYREMEEDDSDAGSEIQDSSSSPKQIMRKQKKSSRK